MHLSRLIVECFALIGHAFYIESNESGKKKVDVAIFSLPLFLGKSVRALLLLRCFLQMQQQSPRGLVISVNRTLFIPLSRAR